MAEKGRFERGFDYLSWRWIAKAVLQVFYTNSDLFENGRSKFKGSSDTWCINSKLRAEIHQRACDAWCKLTGLDHSYFPYSEDGVARIYFRIRKRQHSEIEGFDREVDDAIGGDTVGRLPFGDD